MNLKIALNGTPRIPITNSKFLHESKPPVSKCDSYFLTPEELEKYNQTQVFPRDKDKESEPIVNVDKSKLEILQERYPDLDSLLKSADGISMSKWQKENRINNSYFYQLKKKYEEEAKPIQLEPAIVNTTVEKLTFDEAKEVMADALSKQADSQIDKTFKWDKAIEIDHVDTYILMNEAGSKEHICHSLAEAITHIKSNYTLAEIEANCTPKIYKEIPFTMQVSVVVGK